jgi:hypothetical protein
MALYQPENENSMFLWNTDKIAHFHAVQTHKTMCKYNVILRRLHVTTHAVEKK